MIYARHWFLGIKNRVMGILLFDSVRCEFWDQSENYSELFQGLFNKVD